MYAKRLQIVKYESSSGPWSSRFVDEPTWDDIERSIRGLDRDLHPFVFVHFDENAGEDDIPNIEVVGGQSAYSIGFKEDGVLKYYVNSEKGDREVLIWESDQGALVPEKRICDDLELVLEIVKHLCNTNTIWLMSRTSAESVV